MEPTMNNDYELFTLPQYVGSYRVAGNLKFMVVEKPSWFHRQMMRLCFGWVWEGMT